MNSDDRRITLISRAKSAQPRPWLTTRDAPRRLIFVESFGVIPFALARGIEEMDKDVECVVIDGTATASEYLHLLSALPPAPGGDGGGVTESCIMTGCEPSPVMEWSCAKAVSRARGATTASSASSIRTR